MKSSLIRPWILIDFVNVNVFKIQTIQDCGKIDTWVLLASGQKVIKLKTSNSIGAKFGN